MSAYRESIVLLCVLISLVSEPTFSQRRGFESQATIGARFKHQVKKRLDQNGNFSMEAVLHAKAQIDAMRNAGPLHKTEDVSSWNWEWLGPGNVGGRIRDILINPFDRNQFWIASPGGGIWKSSNRGVSWGPVNDFLPVLNVVSLAMDELNTQNMYAGTGEYEYFGGYGQPTVAGRNITGVGIYKSTNGGASWFLLPSTQNAAFHYVGRLAVYPASVNRVLAATAGGVYRTTDGGTTWERLLSPTFGEPVCDVEINPANPQRMLAGTTTDVYLSIDGGAVWNRQTVGTAGKMPASPGRCETAIARTNTNVMYVSIANSTGGDQLWRTTDGGTTWVLRNSYATKVNAYTNALWVSPTDPDFIAVGGTDWLSRSTDGGATFTHVSDWTGYHSGRTTPGFSAHGDFHVIVNDPAYNGSTNKIIFVGNDGGIQRASDITTVSSYNGWTNLANNLGITQFYGGAASPDGKVIVGGTQDLYNVNFYASKPSWGPYYGAEGWWNFIFGDGGFAAVDYSNSSYVYAEAQWLGFDRSTDSGKTYQTARNGLLDAANSAKALFVAPFVIDPNNPAVLVAGGTSIWRTTNRGDQWTSIRGPRRNNAKCSAIDIYKANSGVIWVGHEDGYISFTTNSGSTWNEAGRPGGARFVTDIAINPTPTAYAEVVVTLGGYTTDNVWLSSDNGSTWINRAGQAPRKLPAIQVNSVRYHPRYPNWIYVGTDLGVFASADKGMHWEVTPQSLQNPGPANTVVEEIFWQGTSYLIAATHGRGMFRCNPPLVTSAGEEDAVATFTLQQNYPNPFNPSTTIGYSLPHRSQVTLTLFNVLGQQAAVLVNGEIDRGYHEVTFNASALASGVYFYRMQAGDYGATRRLVILR